jgi:hypothetical protein
MGFGLQKFDLSTITRRLELPEISIDKQRPLTLILAYCGAGNSRWEAFMFRRAAAAKDTTTDKAIGVAQALEPVQADAQVAEAQPTDETNAIVANASFVGWEQVYDEADAGSPAPCTFESAQQFIAEIRERCPDVWRRVLSYVLNVSNFRDGVIDSAALGKK